MADPSPPVGLPNAEFIELKNISGSPLNLAGWKLTTASSGSGSFPDFILPPDSFVVITSTSNLPAFSLFGKAISVPSFPSLPNENGVVSLVSKLGNSIHAVGYSTEWYRNVVKSGGGWSLEMIDTHYPCSGTTNWAASTDHTGGTPCKKNSVEAVKPDDQPPQLLRTWSPDSVTIMALFNEPLDSSSASVAINYSLMNGPAVNSVQLLPPLFDKVKISLGTVLQPSTVYELSVKSVQDCSGNNTGVFNKAKAGRAEEALVNNLAINEILFNPRSGAFDYVELYNPSHKIIDASRLYLGNQDLINNPSSVKKISDQPYFIFPGDFLVITEDAGSLSREYLVKEAGNILVLPALPSFPDDRGTVVILNSQGSLVDEVPYSAKWHFALITNPEGVSLERIDPLGLSHIPDNWHSAAGTSGFGTPGYRNSQFHPEVDLSATVTINPRIFSPDNDGYNDITGIYYELPQPGFVANITIFDRLGRMIRSLVRNGLMGIKGSWTWDGLDENKNAVPTGPYIFLTEIFNLEGKVKKFKEVVVVGRE